MSTTTRHKVANLALAAAGRRRIDQFLEGLQAMDALVALVQHEGRLGAVDIGAHAAVGGAVDLARGFLAIA